MVVGDPCSRVCRLLSRLVWGSPAYSREHALEGVASQAPVTSNAHTPLRKPFGRKIGHVGGGVDKGIARPGPGGTR